jgi:hypothetical protein
MPLLPVSLLTPCSEEAVEFSVNLSAETQQIIMAYETFSLMVPFVPVHFHHDVGTISPKLPNYEARLLLPLASSGFSNEEALDRIDKIV